MTSRKLQSVSGISPALFATLCEIYTSDNPKVDLEKLDTTDIPVLLRILRNTHRHYLEATIVAIHDNVHRMTQMCSPENSAVINRFFDDYELDIKTHIHFEEKVVFKYIEGLLKGERDSRFSVDMLREMHDDAEDKLTDFKNIVMSHLPDSDTSDARYEVLVGILNVEDAIRRHTVIEEKVLMPLAELLEKGHTKVEANPEEKESQDILSEREKEIVKEVARGLTNKEIADKLFISVFTVTTHRKNITQKLGIKTIAGLTVYALMNGLISQTDIEL
ncbi:MAG: helix-turn-helix transcriptional regulator [Bacteroidales bacterium]|nr:helix-turn-helix transcriptional regulator [Bacteroidales bacterium]